MEKKNYLESIRGICAASVALYHFQMDSIFNLGVVKNSHLMVDFFFVLSGYVMFLSYAHRIKSLANFYAFQKKRFWRLYPLHFVTLLIFLGLETIRYVLAKEGAANYVPPFSTNNFSSFVQNLFLVQNLFGQNLTWNTVAWSISVEFYTYMIFGCVLVAFHAHDTLRYLAIFVLILVSAGIIATLDVDRLQVATFRCIFCFFLGGAYFVVEKRLSLKQQPVTNMLSLGVMAVVIWFIGAADLFGNAALIIFPLLCVALIASLNLSTKGAPLVRFLEMRFLVYLGTISYGFYMLHFIIVWFVERITIRLFTIPQFHGKGVLETGNIVTSTAIQLVFLAVVFVAAHLSYRYLEKPMLDRFGGSVRA